MLLWLKTCPRCKGDLFLDNDPLRSDIVCLQCGYRIYPSRSDNYQSVISSLYAPNPSASGYFPKEDFYVCP